MNFKDRSYNEGDSKDKYMLSNDHERNRKCLNLQSITQSEKSMLN